MVSAMAAGILHRIFVSTLADEYYHCVPVISRNQGWTHYHPLVAFWHFP